MRLAQIVFKYLLESALVEEEPAVDVKAAEMAGGRLSIKPTDSSILGAWGSNLSSVRQNANDSLEATIKICQTYPTSAGRFLSVANELKNHRYTPDVTAIPKPWTKRTTAHERAWGSHILSQLQTCDRGHPYSDRSFPEECPECGKKTELAEVEFARSAQFLHEDKFLAMMNGKTR